MSKLTDAEKSKKYDAMMARSKKYAERSRIRNKLLANKAIKAGIVVTDVEVDAALKLVNHK